MNKSLHRIGKESHAEHGTTRSYIVGFLLSLVFTAIPYYLVVNKIVSGSTLLATILGFAVLQMAVQVFFFLHLGRGPKPLYNIVFFVVTVGAILVVVVGSIFIINNLNYNMSPKELTTKLAEKEAIYQLQGVKTGACQGVRANHQVIINSGRVRPLHTEARMCDTLTFINEDKTEREIAFGLHPEHRVYGGETQVMVYQGHAKTITLNTSGTYLFHDHLEPETTADFTVTD